mmetsp:Transcript_6461/g.13736  ORF Transcript_6461/g.13736 Transcript_6461/m.13736 type:complete len:142 (+) Transcript_6461:49-474(+)
MGMFGVESQLARSGVRIFFHDDQPKWLTFTMWVVVFAGISVVLSRTIGDSVLHSILVGMRVAALSTYEKPKGVRDVRSAVSITAAGQQYRKQVLGKEPEGIAEDQDDSIGAESKLHKRRGDSSGSENEKPDPDGKEGKKDE